MTNSANARTLIEGVDLTTWPAMKLQRAHSLLSEAVEQAALWNTSRSFMTPLRLTPDRMFIEFLVPPEGVRAPVREWSLIVGEAFHQARSALDAFAWEVVHLDGRRPADPRSVYFPITDKEDTWRKKVGAYASAPEEIVERMRLVQPWVTGEGADSWLRLVSRVNNDDKHQGVVSTIPVAEMLSIEGMSLRLGDGEEESGPSLSYHSDGLSSDITPGSPLARLGFGAPILDDAEIPATAHVQLIPAVGYRDHLFPVSELLHGMPAALSQMLRFLRSGETPPE